MALSVTDFYEGASCGRSDISLQSFGYLVEVVRIIPIPPKVISERPLRDTRTTARPYLNDPKMPVQCEVAETLLSLSVTDSNQTPQHLV